MTKAIWNGVILAESDNCETVENNKYFPPDAINSAYFKSSATQSSCPWKGTANYYTIVVDGKENKDAAWFYPKTKDAAKNVEGYVAFWKGVQISD